MAASSHAWEHYDHAWEAGEYHVAWDDSSDEHAAPTRAECGEQLAGLLSDLRFKGTLSAKQCCVIAHWAAGAGACGPVSEFCLGPNSQSGHYQRKLDAYLGAKDDTKDFYYISVPGVDKFSGERTVHKTE